MRAHSVVVLGAGIAGLSASLALARDGHRVTLIERDPVDTGAAEEAFDWQRNGIPHFQQPHIFAPRGRKEMREAFPDVHDRLVGAGASEIDTARKLTERIPADDQLRFLAVRRPVIEWGLRRAVLDDPSIRVMSGTRVLGVAFEDGAVTGVQTETERLAADAVVDAMGRRSPVRAWMEAAGIAAPKEESGDCGVIYYTRYYRVRPGATLPDGPWYLSPRGDLGYAAYASFPGDNGTFAALLAVPPTDHELRIVKEPSAHEAAIAQIPTLHLWANPDVAEPITPVMPMAGLHNTFQHFDGSVRGLFVAGDAMFHTDPVLALGVSFALIHGRAVADALREHDDIEDASRAYVASVQPEARERFGFAQALDEARLRMWMGGAVDFAHRSGDYALFTIVAGGVAAMADAEVFRVFLRRIGMLDGLSVLDDDVAMQERIESLFAGLSAKPRPPQGPPRDELLAICRAALG